MSSRSEARPSRGLADRRSLAVLNMNLSILATSVLVAAFVVPQNPTAQGPAIALARAEAQWQTRGPKSYRFGIRLTCECSPKGMNFRVVGGQVQLPPGADATSQRFCEGFGTVERLFARIRRAIADGGYRIDVKYDAELGYPIWADLDPHREIIDDELFFRVSDFHNLETPDGARWR